MDACGQLGLFYKEENKEELKTDDALSWFKQPFFALDVETTGLDPASNRIIELALVPFNMGASQSFSSLFSIDGLLPKEIINITGISDDMLKGQPSFLEKADQVLSLLKDVPFIVAYNAKFDRPFVESEFARVNRALPDIPWVDPYIFVCEFDRYKRGKKLTDAAKRWGVSLENAHRAQDDAKAAGELILKMADKIGVNDLSDLLNQQKIWFWQNAHSMAEFRKSSSWEINR